MAKRKSLSQKVRFEVFKRDGFTCQYCGESAPDVILNVDHISPVSKGGDNDVMNLITACFDCNSGKSDRELDDDTVISKQRAQLAELNERREQLEMMLKWRDGLRDIRDEQLAAFVERWSEAVDCNLTESGELIVRKLLRRFSLQQLLDAMDIAIEAYLRYGKDGERTFESVEVAFSKIGGIAYNQANGSDDRGLFYIRGIMRNRFRYCPQAQALGLLRSAVEAGIEIEDLKDLAREAKHWTDFCDTLAGWGVE